MEQGLRDVIDVAVWLTGLSEIPSDSAWSTEMRPKLHAAMALVHPVIMDEEEIVGYAPGL